MVRLRDIVPFIPVSDEARKVQLILPADQTDVPGRAEGEADARGGFSYRGKYPWKLFAPVGEIFQRSDVRRARAEFAAKFPEVP